jgi:hypothetical protein
MTNRTGQLFTGRKEVSAMYAIRLPRRPWRAAVLCSMVLASLGLACGKNRVALDVDVLSFMNQTNLTNAYDTPPLIPFTTRLAPTSINLVEGYQNFGDAQSVALDMAVRYDNVTGAGHARFAVYMGSDASTVFDSPPVAFIDADLTPAATTVGTVQIDADQRVKDLFTSKQLWMGVDMSWDPQSADNLQGTCTISQIKAHMVSTLSVF